MTARYDWTINQGETTTLVYSRSRDGGSAGDAAFPQNSTFRMKAKTKHGGTEVLSLTVNSIDDVHTNSDEFESNTASATATDRETFTVKVSAAKSALIDAPGKYVYDIENVTSDGLIVERVLEGTLIVTPEVTT